MNRKDIRNTNLQLLIEEFETIVAVAIAAGTSEKYLWQVLHKQPLKSGKQRGIGDALADKLEAGCGKPKGWMDTAHDDTTTAIGNELSPSEAELLRQFRDGSKTKRRAILAVARIKEAPL